MLNKMQKPNIHWAFFISLSKYKYLKSDPKLCKDKSSKHKLRLEQKNMKTLAMSAVLLLALGLTACSKDQTEVPADNTAATDSTEVVVDPAAANEEVQPLDAAPLENEADAASEVAAQ